MLFRLPRPMKRPDSSLPQFTQRIPADVRALAVGRTLSVPLGSETAHVTTTPGMAILRFLDRAVRPDRATDPEISRNARKTCEPASKSYGDGRRGNIGARPAITPQRHEAPAGRLRQRGLRADEGAAEDQAACAVEVMPPGPSRGTGRPRCSGFATAATALRRRPAPGRLQPPSLRPNPPRLRCCS